MNHRENAHKYLITVQHRSTRQLLQANTCEHYTAVVRTATGHDTVAQGPKLASSPSVKVESTSVVDIQLYSVRFYRNNVCP